MKLFIKNMQGPECQKLVKAALDNNEVRYKKIECGEVEVAQKLGSEQQQHLKESLQQAGMDLISAKKFALIEKIRTEIIKMIHYSDQLPEDNYSTYLSKQLNHNYTYLANIFSDTLGFTIEHFIIENKIEKVKELMVSDHLKLTEIAARMRYSSVAHLSGQFKKVTGMTPSYYKNKAARRKNSE